MRSPLLNLTNVLENYDDYEEINPTDELFELTENGVTSLGRQPVVWSNPHIEKAKIKVNGVDTYDNEFCPDGKDVLGVFPANNNYLANPLFAENMGQWYTSGGTITRTFETFKGSPLYKLTGDNTATSVMAYTATATGANQRYLVHTLCKIGASTQANSATYFNLYDDLSGWTLKVYWDKTTVTNSLSLPYKITWYGDFAEIWVETAVTTLGNNFYIGIQHTSGNTTTGDYAYFSQHSVIVAQAGPSTNIVPYKQNGYGEPKYQHAITWPSSGQFTLELKAKPMFDYTLPASSGGANIFLFDTRDYDSTASQNNTFALFYDCTNDVITLKVQKDESNTIVISTSAYTTNSQIQQWFNYKIAIDTPNNQAYLYINGVEVTTSKVITGTIAGTKFKTVFMIGNNSIGYSYPTYNYMFFQEFVIKQGLDTSSSHYLSNKLYVNPLKLTGKDKTWGIDTKGNIFANKFLSRLGESGAGIVAYGSNLNGYWIKFDNGALLLSVSKAKGTSAGSVLITFPASLSPLYPVYYWVSGGVATGETYAVNFLPTGSTYGTAYYGASVATGTIYLLALTQWK